jgi:SAM-dependent methyltransferase
MLDSQHLVTVSCNICGADDFTVLYPAGRAQVNQIVRCNHCGLLYANPRRMADHVDIETWPEDPTFDLARERPLRYEKEQLQVRDYADTRKLLKELCGGAGRLLEIGSGLGFMLDLFHKEFWEVVGVEPDRNASLHARRKFGLDIRSLTLEKAGFPDESLDAVVMLHVIEHVPDPMATLREINRILKPGGHLILETPRYDTLMFKILGRRERSLSCDGHIFFFTTDSLRRAYTAAGFELRHFQCPPRSLTLDRLAFNLGVITKSPALYERLKPFTRRPPLDKIKLSINVRDMQRVCVRRVTRIVASPSS